jgi:hypothetical protein
MLETLLSKVKELYDFVRGKIKDALDNIQNDIKYLKNDIDYLKNDGMYIKNDLNQLKSDTSYIKNDLNQLKPLRSDTEHLKME